jgi:hypothetical protein
MVGFGRYAFAQCGVNYAKQEDAYVEGALPKYYTDSMDAIENFSVGVVAESQLTLFNRDIPSEEGFRENS